MKMPLFRKTFAAMIAAVAGIAFCLPACASNFTVGGSGNTFTVSRSGAGVAAAETVSYRTNAQDAVVSLTATWRPNIPYIDEDGTERLCTDYTVLTNATGDVEYGTNGATAWYVVTNAVTISGALYFSGITHLILCDGATLAVTNENGNAIHANDLAIYGQTNSTGTVTAEGSGTGTNGNGIYASSVTINGGNVTANGSKYGNGIFAGGDIILGWTNPTDSITASSYQAGSIRVKTDQRLTDGSAIYKGHLGSRPTALAGVTLRPTSTRRRIRRIWACLQTRMTTRMKTLISGRTTTPGRNGTATTRLARTRRRSC